MIAEIEKLVLHPFSLSDSQKDAVLSEDRFVRTVASAGAGKTEVLTRRLVYLLLKGNIPDSIVAFTFTERAAAQIKERVYLRVGEIIGEEFKKQLTGLFVGTIHSYCLRILQEKMGYGNYALLDENAEMSFVIRHADRLGFSYNSDLTDNCETFIRSSNVIYDEMISKDDLPAEDRQFKDILEVYEELLEQNRLLNFSRVIRMLVDRLEKDLSSVEYVKHLVVDEYQDINRSQERLIHIISNNASCFIVGDPKQCIYQWRGSDSGCFERFKRRFGASTFFVQENNRSANKIVSMSNNLVRSLKSTTEDEIMAPVRELEGTVICTFFETPEEEAKWVASQVKQLVDNRICSRSDIAILLRSVKTSGPDIINALREFRIPYIVGGKVGLFHRDEAQALGRILAWCADMPWKESEYDRRYVRGDDLLRIASQLWLVKFDVKELHRFKREIFEGRFKDFTDLYQSLLETLNFKMLSPEDDEHATVIANLGRFNGLLVDYESALRFRTKRDPSWEYDLKGLIWFISTYALGAYEEQPSDPISSIDAVQVMTIHQAKGLEWPIVFIPCLKDGRFPSSMTGRERRWLLSDKLFERARYEGSIEDERRLFYVAATRARDGIVFSFFKRTEKQNARPSPFIDEIGIKASKAPGKTFCSEVDTEFGKGEDPLQLDISDFINYLRCPYFYRLRTDWGFRARLSPELGFGRSVHQVLRVVAERAREGDSPREVLNEAFEEFHLPYAGKTIKERSKAKAREVLEQYVKDREEDFKQMDQVESRIEFELPGRAVITGRVDVIMNKDGGAELREYKTADDQRTIEEAALQVQLYALGLKEMGTDVKKGSIALLMKGELMDVDVDDELLSRARFTAESCVRGILNRKFDGKESKNCQSCDYKTLCKYFAKD